MFYELNEILRLLSTCFGAFLLASIAVQFITSIQLFYNLFLTFNGLIEFSIITTLIPMFAWLLIQFSVLMTFITGCEKVSCEISCFSSTLCHSMIADKESFKNVRKIFFSKKFLRNIFQLILLQLLMIQTKTEFNAGKLFPINYQLMTLFFSAIISYLIVIVQFHLQNWKIHEFLINFRDMHLTSSVIVQCRCLPSVFISTLTCQHVCENIKQHE